MDVPGACAFLLCMDCSFSFLTLLFALGVQTNTMTDKPHIERLRDVIRELHGVPAQHVESVPVTETHQGQIVWDGVVGSF